MAGKHRFLLVLDIEPDIIKDLLILNHPVPIEGHYYGRDSDLPDEVAHEGVV